MHKKWDLPLYLAAARSRRAPRNLAGGPVSASAAASPLAPGTPEKRGGEGQ